MIPKFVVAGKLTREFLLPLNGVPLLDSPGGSLLYASGGLAVWDANIGLLTRVRGDYPNEQLEEILKRGFDVEGIRKHPELVNAEMRSFIAYNEKKERSNSNAVSHFARLHLNFPKSLLGYQAQDESQKNTREIDPLAPTALEVPGDYRQSSFIHICPFDFRSQSQLVNLFRSGANQTVTLDPAPDYMIPEIWGHLRIALQGVTAFYPSEE